MQAEEAPPTYSEYPTELPDLFPIGKRQAKPLVNVTELQAHLKLLGAFHELKREVEAQAVEAGVANRSQALSVSIENKDQAWVIFVNRAVHRFFAWTSVEWNMSLPGLHADVMPPLDVLMVWHTYLLVRGLYIPLSFHWDSRLYFYIESSVLLRRSKPYDNHVHRESEQVAVSYPFLLMHDSYHLMANS
jgi:hypothetical protein